MLKHKFLKHLLRLLIKDERHLRPTIIKSITLWILTPWILMGILMASVSCQCGNSNETLFSFEKENTLSLKVDNPTLRGEELTFCLTIENTSNKTINLSDYELKTNIQKSSITPSSIYYKSKRGYTQDLSINQMIGVSFMELTDQFVLKLNPGETLCLPSFTIDPAKDNRDLSIHFELIGHFDKNPTATATVTWQDVSYQLEFQELQNWVGDQPTYFKLYNNGDEQIDLNNIIIQITPSNQVEFKLNNRIVKQPSKFNLAELLKPEFSILHKGATTPPITLQIHEATRTSAKVTLNLCNKRSQNLAYQSIMWYSTGLYLEGDDSFVDKQMQLNFINQLTQINTEKIKVYLTSTNGINFILNGQQVPNNGLYLSDILQGKKVLDVGTNQPINLAVANPNPSQALGSDITLELRDETNKVLVRKKIGWGISQMLMQDLKSHNTSLGLVLKLLQKGWTLQEIIKKIGSEKGRPLLHDAIEYSKKYGKEDVFYIFLNAGADVNAKNEDNATPLHVAVKEDQVTIVKSLLAAKVSTTAKDKNGQRPIYITIKNGNQEIINLLLPYETSSSIADKDNLERNLLHWAAIGGQPNVVKTLLQKGSSKLINQQDCEGKTALHLAAFAGDLGIVDVLLAKGANKNIQDNYKKKPIDYAKSSIIKAKLR